MASNWNRWKTRLGEVTLDTITTRFFMLFLFILVIPLFTVILFTTTLIENYQNKVAQDKLQFADQLIQTALSERVDALNAALSERSSIQAVQAYCRSHPDSLCRLEDVPAFDDKSGFAVHEDRLYAVVLRYVQERRIMIGQPVRDIFLNRLIRQHPNLRVGAWLVASDRAHRDTGSKVLAATVNTAEAIPVAPLLEAVDPMEQSTPLTLRDNRRLFKVYQRVLYGMDHQPVARVVVVLPLKGEEELRRNYYGGIYLITMAGILFSVALAMVAGRPITQPLIRLVKQVNTLSRSNLGQERVNVKGVYEINQLNRAFNRMLDRLHQEQKLKDEFVAALTHDLKVPLLAEKQTLAYLDKEIYGPLSDEQKEVVEVLRSSNASCLAMVTGLLEVYRYESGNMVLRPEPVDLMSLLQEAVQELGPLAEEKAIALKIEGGTGEGPVYAYADPIEIKRVFHNLISNAVINTARHGTITCRIETADSFGGEGGQTSVENVSGFSRTTLRHAVSLEGRVLVSVQDSGIGFSTDDLEQLFTRFAASKGRNPLSMGLGLYNCHQVVSAHHGMLWVETTEGEGSAVNFVLPQTAGSAEDRRQAERRSAHDNRKQME